MHSIKLVYLRSCMNGAFNSQENFFKEKIRIRAIEKLKKWVSFWPISRHNLIENYVIASVARNYEKSSQISENPKSSTSKHLWKYQRSFKRQKYLHQSTKRKSQNRFKTGLKPVFTQIFKSSQKGQVAKQKILVAKWCQK